MYTVLDAVGHGYKRMLRVLLICCSLLASPLLRGDSLPLSLVPATQTVPVGTQASLDVVISGFTSHPPSIGAFDISVSFDPAILAFHSVDFGSFLGDPFLEALTALSVSSGLLELAEVSLLDPATLDSLQPLQFTLATLTFDTLAVGSSRLAFTQLAVDDAFGLKLQIAPLDATVNVVPEPASLILLATAAAALRWRRSGATQSHT